MEVGQSQDTDMTEAAPKVYDILHPTPVSLKALSAMVISLEIWRREANEYRTSGKLREFRVSSRIENTGIKLPDLPSTIHKTINKFFNKFATSVLSWLREHHKRVFDCYSHENSILQYFDDFVCDYDGSIHYTRTAERMMRSVGFNNAGLKFKIACTYFFEDDIQRIWPSVSGKMKVDLINFDECPQLYYWICRLTNQLCKVPNPIRPWVRRTQLTVDERMFDARMPYNRPSFEYFWNRIPVEKQLERPQQLNRLDFIRFILPKLNDRQLDQFFNNGHAFYSLFRYLHRNKKIFLRFWLYIKSKNIMHKYTFSDLVVDLIEDETNGRDEIAYENWEYLCREIWIDSPLDFKQSTISLISSDGAWLSNMDIGYDHHSNQIHVEFLLLILQDASLKERHSFWHNCWETLIEAVRTKHLQRMMRLCLKNEDEITQFKQNFIISSPFALRICISLFIEAYFDELNACVSFCCPELQSARNFKEQILRSVFLNQDEYCRLSREIVCGIKEFNNFVRDVSADFKNELVLSSYFLKRLSSIICDKGIPSKKLTKFIRIFVSTKKALRQVKKSLIDSLKEYLSANATGHGDLFRKPKFNSILLWCLGSDEAVGEFKLTCTSS
ncbi:uncharacterized protein LOC135847739 isoform X6 [Planococcus citri]|uniref:uncharacterized protein LOC135847739 isoform X6 n=1 Tax=Planococcus citri TaxID=170843 RepID=UPI0031F8278C